MVLRRKSWNLEVAYTQIDYDALVRLSIPRPQYNSISISQQTTPTAERSARIVTFNSMIQECLAGYVLQVIFFFFFCCLC